jgi:serine protease Do
MKIMKIILLCGLLQTSIATCWSAPVPVLQPSEKWLAVASTKDIDTAKGIAGYYAWQGARVMGAKEGWFAVVLGPFKAKTVDEVKAAQPNLAEELPKDALLSSGSRYLEQVWHQVPLDGSSGPLAEYGPDRPAHFSAGDLTVDVTMSGDEGNPGSTTVKGTENGQTAFTFSTPADFAITGSNAGLLHLDPATGDPQVVVTRFTGGAHCCTMTWIITKPQGATSWTMIEGQMLDGSGYGYEDVNGDGTLEMVNVDNSFLYAFESYVGSFSVQRYNQLRGGKINDFTNTPAMRPYLKQQLAWFDFNAKLHPEIWKSNAFLAAWVAIKNILGEGDEAWSKMENNFDAGNSFGPQGCTTGQKVEECPAENLKPIPFPRALAQFLRDQDYGPLPAAALEQLK